VCVPISYITYNIQRFHFKTVIWELTFTFTYRAGQIIIWNNVTQVCDHSKTVSTLLSMWNDVPKTMTVFTFNHPNVTDIPLLFYVLYFYSIKCIVFSPQPIWIFCSLYRPPCYQLCTYMQNNHRDDQILILCLIILFKYILSHG